MSQGTEKEAVLANRLVLYTAAARLFAEEPNEQLLDALASQDLIDQVDFFDDDATSSAWTALMSAAEGTQSIGTLQTEFTVVMIGPDKLPASPWESTYLEKGGVIFQEITRKVRNDYAAAGFVSSDQRMPDDHIAIELNFIAALAMKSLEACTNDDEILLVSILSQQQSFIDEHLIKWIPSFAQRLSEAEYDSPFYKSAARFAEAIIIKDIDLLNELL